MLKIRLARVGKKNQPQFRFVVTNHISPVKTNFIEVLGSYHPKAKNKIQSVKVERIKYWLGRGAHLSERAIAVLRPYLVGRSKLVLKEIKALEQKKERRKAIAAKKKQEEKTKAEETKPAKQEIKETKSAEQKEHSLKSAKKEEIKKPA
ncbi:MAG: 30S ribosomal protein S16 [Patescibacteria group bacterium]